MDVIWGAHYLQNRFKLPTQKIGLYGGSHGGYAVLRTLTMPDSFEGHRARFDFGFGICWAGFADLIDFYKHSNIPDWLVNLLGPFETNEQKYWDRSPVNHFDRLESALFVVHGSNDNRVPPSIMTKFLDLLRRSSLNHDVYELQGAGHGLANQQQEIDWHKRMVTFIEKVLKT